ncbi:MAG: Tetratricopeptide TPR_1 repeat-containing protein [Microgenomates group bacterium GW2011_GWB1_44_8]|nr:MAG: Tetratricopeptide TPR_1 repeat-containing protein [Microgenomates group bacterium GW2011_GWB1_44_8]
MKRFLAVGAVLIFLFLPSLSNFFFSDDWFHLRISRINSVGEFIDSFSFSRTAQFAGSYAYRPLSTQTFFFIFQSIFGLNPFPYHLFSLITFVITLYLLHEVVMEMSNNKKMALISVFAYGVSATNFTRLYYISAFQEVLMVALLVGAILIYLRSFRVGGGSRGYIAVYVIFILSLLSKETAVVFPGILFLIDWWKQRISIKRLVPFIIVALVYSYFRFVKLGSITGESYIWDFSLKKAGNSLMWYGFWSLGAPEFFMDYVSSGLRVLPRFFVDFASWAYVIIFLLVSLSLGFVGLVARRFMTYWKTIILGGGLFIGGLLPVIFLPWHKFTLQLGLPMVGVALIFGVLLKKRSFIAYSFALGYVALNVLSNVLYLSHNYTVGRADLSYRVYEYYVKNYPTPPRGSYFEFVNDTTDYGKQWGSSKQIAQATSSSNMFKVLYNDPNYEVYFEDYPGPRPSNERKIEVSTKMFTQ